MSNLPIQFTDKVNSPELLAIMQQFGEHTYVDAELINKFRDAINELHNSLNPDRIISLGTETIVGNEYTYEGYTWQLGGVQINNIGNPIQIVLPSATTGFKRNDISVFKSDGTIERIAGTETDGEIVSTPDVPEGTLYFKTYFIDGNVIESEPEPPTINGSIFKKKSENSSLKITATGEEQIINLSLGGQMHYIVTSTALISVAGFSPHLLNMGGNPLYPGQDLIFENQTGNPVTLINAHTIAPIKFNEGADIIVPNGGKLWFRINEEFAKLMMKSWSEVDLSTKADLVGGKVPASQLPSYVDDVLEFTDLASFPATGESGKIYVALDTNYTYRWSGSAYVKISDNEKLDKSSTPSSVYTTDEDGLQVMKPISDFQPAGDYVTVNTTQTVDGNKTFNDVGLIKKVNTANLYPNQSGGSFAIGGDGGYDSFYFYSFDCTDQDSFGSVQIYSNPEKGNTFYHISLDDQYASYLRVNYFDLSLINSFANQRTALYVDGENSKIKIEGTQNKFAALGTSLITGTEYFEFPNQSGTLALLSDLTDTQNALNLKLPIESPSTTGTVISFTVDKVYGTLTTPETGNITADFTNAKLGVTNIIIHNSGTAPTFDSQFKKLSGSGNYVTGVVNYIYCTYISTTEIIYSINQRA